MFLLLNEQRVQVGMPERVIVIHRSYQTGQHPALKSAEKYSPSYPFIAL